MVRAEIITIGDEILYGQILDTNTQWISLELDKIGIKTIRKSSVGDQRDEIVQILEEAQKRADIVFITGGLGPTKDDLTKKILADFFNCPLAYHAEALADVTDFFAKRGRELSDINRDQALLPTKCTIIPNKQGTAPAMWFNEQNTIWISMPGVPFEMKAIMGTEVLPRIVTHFKLPVIVHQIRKVVGIGESYLSDLIQDWELQLPAHLKLAYLPSLGIVKLRLTGFGQDKVQLQQDIDAEFEKVMPLIKGFVFGREKDELAAVVGQLLVTNQATLAVAESCTGGYLAHQFTQHSGSSAYFQGGIISYANDVKEHQLGVSKAILETDGAVSEACVKAMAEGARKQLDTTYALATSGIAGPDGGTEEKPVGTIWIALAHPNGVITRKLTQGGTRIQNIHLSSLTAINLLRRYLLNDLAE
ncbi:competence/damage-inducible protein A [Aquirufa regiilacus]|uniref:CinA-like protein n=1 Tax=Aquirufa regiilacus TaxID=3024868 RepID=A0ABU3TQF6_9BACT|nr:MULTISPECIES: competence/damage-inducible protein A [unclassified Aquirufa]MDT8887238.1 competence/damage-inducible protein A [Aquirufa sp. LEPPI-3A]MDU0808086.1 competence/damage-inducible protein A [Aquirufa sp. LEOWEIH-7C]